MADHALHHDDHPHGLAHQFEDMPQQKRIRRHWHVELSDLRKFCFFGGFFATYLIYRSYYPEAFFEGSSHLDIPLGAL